MVPGDRSETPNWARRNRSAASRPVPAAIAAAMIRGTADSRVTTRRSRRSGMPVRRSRLNGRLRSGQPGRRAHREAASGDGQAGQDHHVRVVLPLLRAGLRVALADGERGTEVGVGGLQGGSGPLGRRGRPVGGYDDHPGREAGQVAGWNRGGGPDLAGHGRVSGAAECCRADRQVEVGGDGGHACLGRAAAQRRGGRELGAGDQARAGG